MGLSEGHIYVILTKVQREGLTKRNISRDVAIIFDPLGFLNPVVLRAKIFLQEI